MNDSLKRIVVVILINMILQGLPNGSVLAGEPRKWGTVVGYVNDRDSNAPIPYANVFFHGTTLGSTTNSEGFFQIERVRPGSYKLVVRMIGYRPVIVRDILVKANDVRVINITMKQQALQLDGVSVEADRKTGVIQQEHSFIGMEVIGRKRIISMPGAWEDANRAISVLPSVKGRNDLNTFLYVRGGSPDQNLVLYDGMEILNPSRLVLLMGGGVSVCNPDVIKSMVLSPGGFGAEYGNKMSALLNIATRSGRKDYTAVTANTGLVSARATAEGPWAKRRGSWLLAGRRSFYDVVANTIYSQNYVFPFFYDIHAKLDYDMSVDDRLSVSFVTMGEGAKMLSLEKEEMDVINRGRGNIAIIRYNSIMSPKLATQLLVGYYNDNNDLKLYDTNNYFYNAKLDYSVARTSLRGDMLYYPSTRFRCSSGLQVTSAKTMVCFNMRWRSYVALPQRIDFDDSYQHFGHYINIRFRQKAWLELIAGGRYDYSTLYNQAELSPRLKMSFAIGRNSSLWAITGLYYQFPDILTIIERGQPLDITRDTENLGAERALHRIVGFEHRWNSGISFKLEGYEKYFDRLLVSQDQIIYLAENSGKGYARGVEISFRKERSESSKLGFWGNYSYSVAQYRDHGDHPWRYFDYDQRHAAALGADVKLYDGWSLFAVWRFGTGFPYTPLTAFRRGLNSLQGIINGWELLKDDTNSARYPNYNRCDIKLSYMHKFGRRKISAYLDFINMFNNKNVYLYEWDFYQHANSNSYVGKRTVIYMLPFIPSFGISVDL
jgi:hypothetical protein